MAITNRDLRTDPKQKQKTYCHVKPHSTKKTGMKHACCKIRVNKKYTSLWIELTIKGFTLLSIFKLHDDRHQHRL